MQLSIDEYLNVFPSRSRACVSIYPPPSKIPKGGILDDLMELDKCNIKRRKSIYIHVPFCEEICSFCPFNKFLKVDDKVNTYLKSLYREIDLYSKQPFFTSAEFESLYFGGGTPSCLSAEQIIGIINTLKQKFNFSSDVMIFVEGNPLSFTKAKLKSLLECGVNRISMGVQTFSDRIAKNIEIPQTPAISKIAIEEAHEIGYQNIGIDLLYPLPEMTDDDWLYSIDESIRLKVDHISLIAFALIPNTNIFNKIKKKIFAPLAGIAKEIELYLTARQKLLDAGYIQYSLIDFCLPNKIDLYADIYFKDQGDILALGPAAYGYLNGYMYVNVGDLLEYNKMIMQNKVPVLLGGKADKIDAMHGAMVKGLRMLSINKNDFKHLFDVEVNNMFGKTIERLIAKGLLYENENEISLTIKGIVWGNNVCEEFYHSKHKNTEIVERKYLVKGKLPEKLQKT